MIEAISYFNPWSDKATLRDLNKIETWQKVGAVALSGIEAIVIVAVARQVSSISNYVLVPLAGLCAFATFRWLIERAVDTLPLPPPQIEMTANRIFWGLNADPSFDAKAFQIKSRINGSYKILHGYVEAGNDKVTMKMLLEDVITKFKTSEGLDVDGKEFLLNYAGNGVLLNFSYLDFHEKIGGNFIRLIVKDEKSTRGIVWSFSQAPPNALSFCIKAFRWENMQVLYGHVEADNDKLTMQMLMDDAVEELREKGLAVEGKKFRLILSSSGFELPLNRLYSDLHEDIKQGHIWLDENGK